MSSTAKKRGGVSRISQVVRPVAFQMNWSPAKVTLRYQPAHLHHLERELVIVTDGYFQIPIFGQVHQ